MEPSSAPRYGSPRISIFLRATVIRHLSIDSQVHYGDLHPLSYYIFRVFARNARGVGAPSAESAQLFVPRELIEDYCREGRNLYQK